jgi:alcohol dehydrogenase class IV
MQFEFATATRIIFGPGTVEQAPELARSFGRSPLVVIGSRTERAQPLASELTKRGLTAELFSIRSEPTTEDVIAGARRAREGGCDLVIAFGGGKAIDGGKAIAAMATNHGDLLDYMEVVGRGRALENPPLPSSQSRPRPDRGQRSPEMRFLFPAHIR